MKPELLAPAGNLERLRWAAAYGADAVYFGIGDFSLRSFAGNFSLEDADNGLKHLHSLGKRGYVTLNIYPFSNEYEAIKRSAVALDDLGADAFIVSDFGVMMELTKMDLRAPIHVSTQANTTSYQAALAYKNLGAKRVNLARELSLEQIREIQTGLAGSGMEVEVFIHGSVCFSYSGRCAISDYLTGRRANRGECTQPCRWKYALVEETRPGQYFPVEEDNRGLYLLNSRDLALFEFIKDLADCGVSSLKIEGRGKNIHYLASVLSLYRAILDGEDISDEKAWELLGRVNNRGYSYGFMKGEIGPDDYEVNTGAFQSTSVHVANTTSRTQNGMRICQIKNTIHAGEELELISPDGVRAYRLPSPLITTEGLEVEAANNQDEILLEEGLGEFCILRRVFATVDNVVTQLIIDK